MNLLFEQKKILNFSTSSIFRYIYGKNNDNQHFYTNIYLTILMLKLERNSWDQ